MTQRFRGLFNSIRSVGQFFLLGPKLIISVFLNSVFSTIGFMRYFVWPKETRRRYRTALFAVFLLSIFAANLDYPKYWNRGADWLNPKLGAVNTPDFILKYDKWGVTKAIDNTLRVPAFWDISFSQGLDLRGGIHLIYEADLSEVERGGRKEAMNGLRDVIERRVNLFGVREPQVLVEEGDDSYRLIVELAGIQDFNSAIKLIGETPFLEFKEERDFEDQKRIFQKASEGELTDEQIRNLCANATPQVIDVVSRQTGEDPCFKSTSPAPLTGKYVESASVQLDPTLNQPVVALDLNDEGKELFEEITGQNIGKPLAIYLDGILRGAPRVQDKISGGRAHITGLDIEEAKRVSRDLNSGALPVPITLISQQSIGASLGEQSLRDSLRAGIFGAIAVIIFMAVIYRVSGLLAVVSLAIYMSLFLSIIKLVPVTLTLPGIAGFILSIGMAVDANILVFERLREEMAREKDGHAEGGGSNFVLILNNAYERAWSSIRDGNVSTLITAAILFWFSTSFIKGFALTLGIGVAVSMFSAMVVTKYLMRLLGEGRLGKKISIWIR